MQENKELLIRCYILVTRVCKSTILIGDLSSDYITYKIPVDIETKLRMNDEM